MTKTKYYLKTNQGVVLGIVKVNEENNVLHWNEVVGLLNTLNNENEQLKQQSSEKQEHITHLKSKIHRMREQIHKLEKLYHYRSADIKRENEQLRHDATILIQANQEYRQTIKELERKLRITSAHLLSDECALTDGQLRKIMKELDEEKE